MTTLQDADTGHDVRRRRTRAHWWILVVIAGAQLMVVLDSTIMIIALPSAQHALGFSNTDRQWVVTAYTLAFGGFLLLGGRISDMFGPKRTLMTGVAGLRPGVGRRRRRPDHPHADRRPRAAGPLRRAAGAVGAVDPHLDLHRPAGAGSGLRDLRHHRHRRIRLRADPRRLPDRVRRLALVPVREPAHRGAGPLRRLHHDPRRARASAASGSTCSASSSAAVAWSPSSTGSARPARAGGAPPTSSSPWSLAGVLLGCVHPVAEQGPQSAPAAARRCETGTGPGRS